MSGVTREREEDQSCANCVWFWEIQCRRNGIDYDGGCTREAVENEDGDYCSPMMCTDWCEEHKER